MEQQMEILKTKAYNAQTGVMEVLETLDNEFAQSLVAQFENRGSLSEKQWFWAEKLASEASQTGLDAMDQVDLSDLVDFMHKAGENLKFPKIRLATEGGHRVVLSVAGPRAKRPGTINVTDGGPFGDNTWFGRIALDGTFEPSRSCTTEVQDMLNNMADDPAGVATAHGHKTGNCCFCNRELTDARSTKVGFGPTCAENFGLAWGEK